MPAFTNDEIDEGINFSDWLHAWMHVFITHAKYGFEMPTNIAPFAPYPVSKVKVLPKEFGLFEEYLETILSITEVFSFESRKDAERVVFMLSLFLRVPNGESYAVFSYGPKEHWIGRSAGWRKNAPTQPSSTFSTRKLGSTRMFAKPPVAITGQHTTAPAIFSLGTNRFPAS